MSGQVFSRQVRTISGKVRSSQVMPGDARPDQVR